MLALLGRGMEQREDRSRIRWRKEILESNVGKAFLETTPELHRCELSFDLVRVVKVRSEFAPVWTLTRGNTTSEELRRQKFRHV